MNTRRQARCLTAGFFNKLIGVRLLPFCGVMEPDVKTDVWFGPGPLVAFRLVNGANKPWKIHSSQNKRSNLGFWTRTGDNCWKKKPGLSSFSQRHRSRHSIFHCSDGEMQGE